MAEGRSISRESSRTICAGVTTVRFCAARAVSVSARRASRSCWRASAAANNCLVAASSEARCPRSRRSARQATNMARTTATMKIGSRSRIQERKGIIRSNRHPLRGARSGRYPGEDLRQELQVVRAAGEHLRGIERVRTAIPGKQGARSVAAGGVKLLAQYFAADGQSLLRIAKRGKKLRIEAGLASDLPHHLHQSPGEAAC